MGGGLSGMGSSTLSQILGRPVKAPRKYGGYFRNDADHRDYVSIGAAAGDDLTSDTLGCVAAQLPGSEISAKQLGMRN